MTNETDPYLQIAEALDSTDPMASYRSHFDLPKEVVYLDGNSLGALQNNIPARLSKATQQEWGQDLITSWNKAGWVDLPQKVGDQIAPIIGAVSGSVVATDSTSVNAFKVLAAGLLINSKRRKIVTEKGNFPTDLYMMQALTAFLGMEHELVMVEDDETLLSEIDDQTAVVFLTQVDYRTGRKLDMAKVTAKANNCGAIMIWDLAHSAGAFPVDLTGCNADFAIGCGYKYLNGGPGAPAFVYVKPELQQKTIQPLSGWFAHDKPFEFEPKFRPSQSIKRYLCGTPPVLSLIALDEALKIWGDVDMKLLHAKSIGLSQLFVRVIQDTSNGIDLLLASPPEAVNRGSQVSFRSSGDGYAIMQALISQGVVGDFRAPDLLRFGFAPLYNTYFEVVQAAHKLVEIVESGSWDKPEFTARKAVT